MKKLIAGALALSLCTAVISCKKEAKTSTSAGTDSLATTMSKDSATQPKSDSAATASPSAATENIITKNVGKYPHENSLFEVPKPLVTKGIGFDLLPDAIKYSKIFTGNDLGMLANTEVLPDGEFHADENIHLDAQKLLLESKIEEAWNVLIMK